MRERLATAVHTAADWLSTIDGFIAIVATFLIGLGLGGTVGWSIAWQSPYNLYISLLTAVVGLLVLVSGAKQAQAGSVKLDEILTILKADRRFIGLENATDEQIERLRKELVTQAGQGRANDPTR